MSNSIAKLVDMSCVHSFVLLAEALQRRSYVNRCT